MVYPQHTLQSQSKIKGLCNFAGNSYKQNLYMGFFASYIEFIFRPPNGVGSSVAESRNDMLALAAFWSLFFSSICVFSSKVLGIVKKDVTSIPLPIQKEIPVYISSLIHHCLAVPYSLWRISEDYFISMAEFTTRDYSVLESGIIPFCFGYLFADTVFYAIGAARKGNYETLLHHILGLGLFYLAYNCPGHILRYVPHIIICESSAIFFNLAWLLRNLCQIRGSTAVVVVEYLFAFLFFLTRIINLPMVLWAALSMAGEFAVVGRVFCYPIVILQFYWFYKIICSVLNRKTAKSS